MIVAGKNSFCLSGKLRLVIYLNRAFCTHKISILETNKSLCCLRLCVIITLEYTKSKISSIHKNIFTLLASLCKRCVL